jgi:hypothetical protein
MRVIVLAAALTVCPDLLLAQANTPRTQPIDFAGARIEATRDSTSVAAISAGVSESEARMARAQADYVVWSLEYRRASFNWQYWSTIVIFVCIMTIIGSGLYFSYMQFRSARHAQTQTSIKLGRDGLEISSPVIGLLILVISMGFFYLYLANVYPITEVVGPTSSQTVSSPDEK